MTVINPDGSNIGESGSALRYETVGTITYVGTAEPGSVTSDPVWQIFQVDTSTGALIYADGDDEADNVWERCFWQQRSSATAARIPGSTQQPALHRVYRVRKGQAGCPAHKH